MSLFRALQEEKYKTARGEIADQSKGTVGGDNPNMPANQEVTVGDGEVLLNDNLTSRQFYISSDDNTDIGILVVAGGIDDYVNFNPVNRVGILNGHAQVPLNGNMLFSNELLTLADNAKGNIYLAEFDPAIVNGKPSDSKIQCKIRFNNEIEKSKNVGFTAIEYIPPGKTGYIRAIQHTTGKLKDIDIRIKFLPFGDIWRYFPDIHLSEAPTELGQEFYTPLPEKTIFIINALSKDSGAKLSTAMVWEEKRN